MSAAFSRKAALFAATVAGLALAVSASAAPRTTAPGSAVLVGVRITDQSVNVFEGARASRGSIVTFLVSNAGKKLHNFALLGKKTPTIKPGHSARFSVIMLARGRFLYRSTLDSGPRFRGYFTVY
jgi:hypothetical protein